MMTNFLPDYYWFIREPVPRGVRANGRLMPRVIRSSGWRHAFDVVIRRGLSMLDFFPDFLTKLKALVKFLRDRNLMETLVQGLRGRGLPAVAETVSVFTFPSFAKWRWSTPHHCVTPLSEILETFISAFDPALFRGMRDQTLFGTIVVALGSDRWATRELSFVKWFTAWLTLLQNYVG
eukprot:7920364-Pyramimonas_sp.AAC.1